MAGPGDEIAAGAGGRGHLRVSHADREQVIDSLKAAFVRGVLAKDEFDLRVGQTFAARTYAELAAVTADLPARLTADQPPQPARAQGEPRVLRLGVVLMAGTAVYAAVWPLAFLLPQSGPPYDHDAGVKLVMMATFFYFVFLLMFGAQMLSDWLDKRSGRQVPRGPAPGTGGQSSRRLPPAHPGRQLPPVDHGPRHTAEAARRRLPRPPFAGSRSLRRWRPRGRDGSGKLVTAAQARSDSTRAGESGGQLLHMIVASLSDKLSDNPPGLGRTLADSSG